MSQMIAAFVVVVELSLVAWRGLQAFFAYRASYKVDR
jgi:hypothetical protein